MNTVQYKHQQNITLFTTCIYKNTVTTRGSLRPVRVRQGQPRIITCENIDTYTLQIEQHRQHYNTDSYVTGHLSNIIIRVLGLA